MSYREPESTSDSGEDSFASQESYTLSEQVNMSGSNNENLTTRIHEQHSGPSEPQEQRNRAHSENENNSFPDLSPAHLKALYNQFAREFLRQDVPHQTPNQQSQYDQPPPSQHIQTEQGSDHIQNQTQTPLPSNINGSVEPNKKKANNWPSWDGTPLTFRSYLVRLRAKIEEDRHLLGSDRAVCLGILDSVPDDKQNRVSHWFETGGVLGDYNRKII